MKCFCSGGCPVPQFRRSSGAGTAAWGADFPRVAVPLRSRASLQSVAVARCTVLRVFPLRHRRRQRPSAAFRRQLEALQMQLSGLQMQLQGFRRKKEGFRQQPWDIGLGVPAGRQGMCRISGQKIRTVVRKIRLSGGKRRAMGGIWRPVSRECAGYPVRKSVQSSENSGCPAENGAHWAGYGGRSAGSVPDIRSENPYSCPKIPVVRRKCPCIRLRQPRRFRIF